jgi:cytochrome c oxidase subunit 2
LTEEAKRLREVPQKRSHFSLRAASLIVIMVLIITVFTGGIAYGVQNLVSGEVAEGVPVDGATEFRILAQQWYYNPANIKVNPGDTVRFILTSQDLTHGFAMNELGINLSLPPGVDVTHEIVIPPDMAEGAYTMYCSIFCGIGHPYLKGKIIVGAPVLFLGTDIGRTLPYIATSVMAGMFATFIIIGRRKAR